jgi:hypothetical protein
VVASRKSGSDFPERHFVNRTILTLFVLLAGAALAAAGPVGTVSSPDGKVEMTFGLGAEGQPLYSVTYGGTRIVADSALGLTLNNGAPLATGFRVVRVRRTSHDVPYTLVAGRTREGWDRCEELTVDLHNI